MVPTNLLFSSNRQKLIIGTLIYMLTTRRKHTDCRSKQSRRAHLAVFKKMLPKEFLSSANFHLIFNTIANTSGYFKVKSQDPHKVGLNICTIAQVAEMLEQFHNHVAALMQGTKNDFDFLDQIKEAVNYAKYLRDKLGHQVPIGTVFNLLNPSAPSELPPQTVFVENLPQNHPTSVLLNNGMVLQDAFHPKNRTPPQKLPMSALLAPLQTEKKVYSGYTHVGFFQ